jgi:hypothetical protein
MDDDAAKLAEVRRLASKLATISASDESLLGVRGLIVGAAYSLAKALELGYEDLTGRKRPPGYGDTVLAACALVATGETPNRGSWLANYYYNNAIIRLAVARERLRTHKPPRPGRRASIREEVNIFKHEFAGLLGPGRAVQPPQAVHELASLVARFEAERVSGARRRRTRG